MAITTATQDQWNDGKRLHVTGVLTFTGNYTVGGVLLDFTIAGVPSSTPPSYVSVTTWQGYNFVYVNGTAANNGKLQVWSTSTGTELAAGAFPPVLTGGTPKSYGIFKMV
jgi:hypothetical protein